MPLKDDLHKFVDTHIREIQYTAYGIGALGLFLVIKDLHLASTFRHASEIPQKFITNHVTLQGRVQAVDALGKLQVSHQPVFTLPFSGWIQRLRSGVQPTGVLTVEVAGVALTSPATQWLSQRLTDQHVWFALLHASPHSLLCSVYTKKNLLFKLHINEALVKEGLAPVLADPDLSSLPPEPAIQSLVSRLQAAENLARKKKRGMWKEKEEGTGHQKVSVWRRVVCWVRCRLKGAASRGKSNS